MPGSTPDPSRPADPSDEARRTALRRAHQFFDENSGWAPPDDATMAEWAADGLSLCPDECVATVDGWCEHGIASWAVVLADPDDTGR